MRNVWFHRQIAEYISTARDIDPKTVVAQRDFSFSMSDEEMERQAKRSAELRRLAELKRSIKPKINPNGLTTKADQEVAVSWWRRMREVWDTEVLQEVIVPQDDGTTEYWPGRQVETDEEILDTIRDSLMTVWHAAGTCKMGKADDETAVIDSQARVFGVEGLRVVDGSSLPLLPPGHPQSTIYALAEKIAADIIADEA